LLALSPPKLVNFVIQFVLIILIEKVSDLVYLALSGLSVLHLHLLNVLIINLNICFYLLGLTCEGIL